MWLKKSTTRASGLFEWAIVPRCLVKHPGGCWGADLTLLLSCGFLAILPTWVQSPVLSSRLGDVEYRGRGDPSFRRMGMMFPASKTRTEGAFTRSSHTDHSEWLHWSFWQARVATAVTSFFPELVEADQSPWSSAPGMTRR